MHLFHQFTQVSNKDEESVTLENDEEDYKNISGFVACNYDCKWWIWCVLKAEEETETVKIMFVHPNVPSVSCNSPTRSDILQVLR
jgi:hypothetical protein